jgi:hypothetical protein
LSDTQLAAQSYWRLENSSKIGATSCQFQS